ncbi:hypothetical protein [Caballeronia sp.]
MQNTWGRRSAASVFRRIAEHRDDVILLGPSTKGLSLEAINH